MAKVTVEPVPPIVVEGMDVLLLLHNTKQNVQFYNWYKGETPNTTFHILKYTVEGGGSVTPGPEYNDRYTIFPNGSLLIQNVNKNDKGNYTAVVTDDIFLSEYDYGQLIIYCKYPLCGLWVSGQGAFHFTHIGL